MNWTSLCGSEPFNIWDGSKNNFGICFQKLVLNTGSFALLAIISSYYCGKRTNIFTRTRRQKLIIYFRFIITFCSLFLAVLQPCILSLYAHLQFYWVDILSSIVQVFGWTLHLAYINTLKTHITRGTRGPRLIICAWVLTLLFHICFARTIWTSNLKPFEKESQDKLILNEIIITIELILQVLYLCSLFPKGLNNGNQYRSLGQNAHSSEHTPLLDSRVTYANYSRFQQTLDPFHLGVAEERVNSLSYLTFYWVNQIMEKGSQGLLESVDDLYELPNYLRSEAVSQKVNKVMMLSQPLSSEPSEAPYIKYSLLRALHKCFGKRFYAIGILKLISDSLAFAGPMLLHELVLFVEGKETSSKGFAAGIGLCATTLISCLASIHFNYLMAKINIQIRAALVTSIYRKIQHVTSATLSQFSSGKVVTLMSTDTDRVINFCKSFHAFWSLPLQLGITLYLLYREIGIAFLAGVIFSLILIPINRFLAVKIASLSKKMLYYKDKRVQLMTELLSMIKAVKLNSWESLFKRRIFDERFGEIKALAGRKYLDAGCVYFWASTPVLIPIITFGTYSALGHEMEPARIFTAVALFNMLIVPLNAFPWVINGLVEAWVSIKRIEKLMQLKEHNLNEYYTVVAEMNRKLYDLQIVFDSASFSWTCLPQDKLKNKNSLKHSDNISGEHSDVIANEEDPVVLVPDVQVLDGDSPVQEQTTYGVKLCLKDLTIHLKKCQFIGIIGSVGSGKTSFLNAILGELEKISGVVAVAGLHQGFGFATQKPWLQNTTIKENIIFGQNFDPSRYRSVIHCCALEEDFELLQKGEDTRCGDNGALLSEGQRARVALARAVYQNKAIYLLDDVLSGIDAPVANQIMQRCIHGLLVGKMVILVTHHINLLTRADWILHLAKGIICRQGPPKEILGEMYSQESTFNLQNQENISQGHTGAIPRHTLSKYSSNETISSTNKESSQGGLSVGDDGGEELREYGELNSSVIISYLSAVGATLCILIFFSLVLMQTSRNLADTWLAKWVSYTNTPNNRSEELQYSRKDQMLYGYPYHESLAYTPTYLTSSWVDKHFIYHDDEENFEQFGEMNPTTKFYLTVYTILAFSNTIFTLIRAFLFAYGGICAAKILHKKLLDSVLNCKFVFFDVNPLGRILNRFSSDIYTTDDSLPFEGNIFLAQLFGLIGTLVVTVYAMPWIMMLYIPLMFVYYNTQDYYRHTSRDLRRIYSLSLSPIYNHFTETLNGLTVIRAMRAGHRFGVYADAFLEQNQRAQFCLELVSQWLNFRLQLIGLGILSGIVLLALLQHHLNTINAGLVGLVISYALNINGALNGVVTSLTSTEREFISVERLNQYIDGAQREGENETKSNNPPIALPHGWPIQGRITYENVYLKYHSHNPYSLRKINLDIKSGENIGIVGRTGAGKTSLFMALFRIAELTRGRITIDNVNIAEITTKKLRSNLAIVSQDALIFTGTLRENLDPRGNNSDEDILRATDQCQLSEVIEEMGGLDAVIQSGNQSMSSGQKQLFCLARALLCRTKIVCIDEGMSLLDYKTEVKIQTVIRNAFANKTVMVIAHRIHTVRDCDRVIVMSNGEIVEMGKPSVLIEDSKSIFHSMFNPQK